MRSPKAVKSLVLRRKRTSRWKWILSKLQYVREKAVCEHKNKSTDPHLELQAGQKVIIAQLVVPPILVVRVAVEASM